MQVIEVTPVFNEPAVQACPGTVGIGNSSGAADSSFVSQIPRLPVVDVSVVLVEHDSRIGPHGACEFVVKARGKHRPLTTVRQANDADPFFIDLRKLRERRVTVRRDESEKRQRLLFALLTDFRQQFTRAFFWSLDRTGRADRQRDETASCQLQAVIVCPLPFRPQSNTCRRVVKRDKHGWEWSVSVRNQQMPFRELTAVSNFDLDPMLREVLAGFLLEISNARFLQQRRPRP